VIGFTSASTLICSRTLRRSGRHQSCPTSTAWSVRSPTSGDSSLRQTARVQRVAIVGSGGAGKTSFAVELARRTGLPVVHLDRLHWKPAWIETPAEEWATVVANVVAGDEWVVDGNYGGTFGIRFERADTVIVLALSRWRCTSRVLWRTVTNYGREVQADGCPERFDGKFIRWVWRYPKDGRRRLDAALRTYEDRLRVVELRTPGEVRQFLEDLGARGDRCR
jgi:adenylate kinase family enzyme